VGGASSTSGGVGGRASTSGAGNGGSTGGYGDPGSFDAPPFIGKDGCTCQLPSSRSRGVVGGALGSLLLGLGLLRRRQKS